MLGAIDRDWWTAGQGLALLIMAPSPMPAHDVVKTRSRGRKAVTQVKPGASYLPGLPCVGRN